MRGPGFLIMLRVRIELVELADAPPSWALCLSVKSVERWFRKRYRSGTRAAAASGLARGAEGSHRPVVDTRRLWVGADVFVQRNAIETDAKRCFDQGGDHRQRRYQSCRQRPRHGDAARDRQCRDANQRPVDASGVSRRPDGQKGRFSGANRSAPLRDFTSAIRRATRTRPGTARPSENRSGPLPNAVAAKFDRAADRGGSGLSRQAVPRDRSRPIGR